MAGKRITPDVRETIINWKTTKGSGYKDWVRLAAERHTPPLPVSVWLERAAERYAASYLDVPAPERERQG